MSVGSVLNNGKNTQLRRMRAYAKWDHALDLEENEDRIRCVAAPLRDVTGVIKAAFSVSSAAQYMNDERMQVLAGEVCWTAEQISRELGWKVVAACRRSKRSEKAA